MDVPRQKTIRAEARRLLLQLWNRRGRLWTVSPNEIEFLRQAPEIVITDSLGLSLEKPEEITPSLLTDSTPGHEMEIAGYIDRNRLQ
jgi:hypothetical protein